MNQAVPIALVLSSWMIASATPALGHERAGGWLGAAMEALHAHNPAQLRKIADNGRALVQGDLATGAWRLQLHLPTGADADDFDDTSLRALGGQVAARGTDLVDVWLPLARVEAFLQTSPQVVFAQLPWRPNNLIGPKYSEGAAQLRPAGPFTCLAADGTGTVVSVLDSGFDGLDKSKATGEVPNILGPVPSGGGSHGTMCAEVVADMAPGAVIYPYGVATFADLQYYVKQITAKGNLNGIDIVSHSVIWLGHSFGRHDGKLCTMTDQIRKMGVAWVSASGNSGNGEFYKAAWNDADKDGLHEFGAGEQRLMFAQFGGTIQITMDWDDYKERKVNLDLYLYRKEGDTWTLVGESKLKANVFVAPLEQVVVQNAKGGVYGLQVRAVGAVPPAMQLRIVAMGGGSGKFSVWHKNGNVYDPASCDGVLTVGAIYQGHFAKGPLEAYSSYGPTPDKRIKPEIMAPTGVSTSVGAFFGTSAACPHAAGALATWVSATGQTPLQAMESMRKAAIPMGTTVPDEAYGWGRVALPPLDLGYACTAADLPAAATCATACASVGTRGCTPTCRWTACVPPAETCNQKDDNCDGQIDDGLPLCVTPTQKEDIKVGQPDSSDSAASEPAELPVFDSAGEMPVVSLDSGMDVAVIKAVPAPVVDGGCTAQHRQRSAWSILALWALGVTLVRVRSRR